MFNKAIQIIAKTFTASENVRPTLAGVYFKWNKIVATNTIKVIEVTMKKRFTKEDVPTNTGFNVLDDNDIDFMIPKKAILDTQIPRNKKIPVIENAYFGEIKKVNNEIESVWIMTNDLEQEKIRHTRVMKSNFPDYEEWLDKKWKRFQFWVRVNELLEICQTMKKIWHRNLKFTVWDTLEPIVIEWEELAEFDTRVVVMPLKI